MCRSPTALRVPKSPSVWVRGGTHVSDQSPLSQLSASQDPCTAFLPKASCGRRSRLAAPRAPLGPRTPARELGRREDPRGARPALRGAGGRGRGDGGGVVGGAEGGAGLSPLRLRPARLPHTCPCLRAPLSIKFLRAGSGSGSAESPWRRRRRRQRGRCSGGGCWACCLAAPAWPRSWGACPTAWAGTGTAGAGGPDQSGQETGGDGISLSGDRSFGTGTGRKNSRTMLLPLLQRFPEQVRVSLFHTPNLRGLLRLLIPERFNETIGLQHIKVYLFDNNIILSGANLSDSYFTNRQDRYVFLQDCPEIADFFTELVDAVGDVSLQLQGDDTVQVVEGMVHPYKGDRAAYCRAANKRVMDVINSARARQQVLHAQTFHGDSLLTQEDAAAAGDRRPAPDTWIYPLIQMKPFEIQIDEIVTETLLTEAERGAKIYLTTGYFNLTQAYMDLVLGTRAEYQILLASPEVNGFFGAKGVAGAIPAAYVHIERQFYREVCSLGQQERVQLQEYWRRGWTFHAKGLWLYLAGSSLPCLTLIGSPNFGYRSVHRDLEAQIAIVTESRALQQQLHQEQEQLYLRSGVVSSSTFEQPSRQVKLWVKMVTPLIKNFF
uniref:CDP-diacylglycerol--glycerol-3-phosphate 3-phosphatidyltransferase n=1 Tax=Canis lupus familiaris TaxID=9615 RepID=A0A8C0M5J2_CANLF